MPLYEYECKQCKRHTEHIQKFSDAEITQCPHCGGLLQRVVTAPAISFKGGGWFADGYSHPKSSESSSESNSASSSSESNSSSSSTPEASAASGKDTAAAASSGTSSPTAPAAAAPPASSSDSK